MPTYTFTLIYSHRVNGKWDTYIEDGLDFASMSAFIERRILNNPRYKLLSISVGRWAK